jgi:hypothetical protein
MTQPIDLDALQAAAEARNLAGAQLANVAFNWSQQMGYVLTSDDCMMLDKLRREWDANSNAMPYLIARLRKAEAASQWVSVKDRLPEPFKPVLAQLRPKRKNIKPRYVVAIYCTPKPGVHDSDEPTWFDESAEMEIQPAHWMPLPAAPSDSVEGAKG